MVLDLGAARAVGFPCGATSPHASSRPGRADPLGERCSRRRRPRRGYLFVRGRGAILGGTVARDQVEIVERVLAAFGRRNLDALLADVDADIEVRPAVVGGLEGTVYRGHAGFRDFVAELDERGARSGWRPRNSVTSVTPSWCLVIPSPREWRSGVELDTASGFVFALRGGKLHSFRSFVSKEAALAAVGLSK